MILGICKFLLNILKIDVAALRSHPRSRTKLTAFAKVESGLGAVLSENPEIGP
jgi:hypothetical protein